MQYHIIAFAAGFLLDLLLGDPHNMPHPIRLIGNLISKTEQKMREKNRENQEERERRNGIVLVVVVLCSVLIATGSILFLAYWCNCYVGMLIEAIMTYYILATRSLRDESMKVYECLKNRDITKARYAVSMIVGRDTQVLDEDGITRAAIETVAENTSDGVVAPMIYTALGGPVLGFVYKAINTMDSMIGYKNERYLNLGRTAAKMDDVANYIPARIASYIMILAAFCGGKCFSGKRACRIYKRDRRKHSSPNAAHTESVCAGALGIRLAGDAVYFGKVEKKPYIGDELRKVEYEDIKRVNCLLYWTACLGELMMLIMQCLIYVCVK